jgi:hypothetical protein
VQREMGQAHGSIIAYRQGEDKRVTRCHSSW